MKKQKFSPEYLKSILPYLNRKNRFIIGFSGGLDSHVLLHALSKVCSPRQSKKITAIHINHSLSPNAKKWELHCKQICKALKINLKIITVNAKALSGQSPEAVAREVRYNAFAQQMRAGDYLLTAHQQDDQAETLLLQLFRGAGIKGLAAMPELNSFAKGYHLRPLLAFTRTELQAYAEKNKLNWIDDESNVDVRFDRNYLRNAIMPKLKQRWPSISATLHRAANHHAETQALLDNLAEVDLLYAGNPHKNTLSVNELNHLNIGRSNNLIRYWLTLQNYSIPTQAQLNHIQKDILQTNSDRHAKVCWDKIELRRFRDDLYVLPNSKISTRSPHEAKRKTRIASKYHYSWNLAKAFTIPFIGTLKATKTKTQGIKLDAFPDNKAIIRFRQTGERCHPVGRQGSHPLKKLFQEWNVPPWERDTIPLLYNKKMQLVAVIGYCICEPFAAKKGELARQIAFLPFGEEN